MSVSCTVALVVTVFVWVLTSFASAGQDDMVKNLLFACMGVTLAALVICSHRLCQPCVPDRAASQEECRWWASCLYDSSMSTEHALQCFSIEGKQITSAQTSTPSVHPAKVAWAKEDDTCHCCLTDFEQQSRVAILPCGHVFHEACIAAWALSASQNASTCPVCRGNFGSAATIGASNAVSVVP